MQSCKSANARGGKFVAARSVGRVVATEAQRRQRAEARFKCGGHALVPPLGGRVVPQHHCGGIAHGNVVLCITLPMLRFRVTRSEPAQQCVRPFARAKRGGVIAGFDPIVSGHVREVLGFRREVRGAQSLRARERRQAVRREIVEMNAKVVRHDARRIVAQHIRNELQRRARIVACQGALLPCQVSVFEKRFRRQKLRIFALRAFGNVEHAAAVRGIVGGPAGEAALIAERHDVDEAPLERRSAGVKRARFANCTGGELESIFGERRVQVGAVGERDSPVRHRESRIERCGLRERTRGIVAVVRIIEEESAIEGGLRLRDVRRDRQVDGRTRRRCGKKHCKQTHTPFFHHFAMHSALDSLTYGRVRYGFVQGAATGTGA